MASSPTASGAPLHPLEVGQGDEWWPNPNYGLKAPPDPSANIPWQTIVPPGVGDGPLKTEEAKAFRKLIRETVGLK